MERYRQQLEKAREQPEVWHACEYIYRSYYLLITCYNASTVVYSLYVLCMYADKCIRIFVDIYAYMNMK